MKWNIAKIKLYWAIKKYQKNSRKVIYIPRDRIDFNCESCIDNLIKELKKISKLFNIRISLNNERMNQLIEGQNNYLNYLNASLDDKKKDKEVHKINKELKLLEVEKLKKLKNLKEKKIPDFLKYNNLLTGEFNFDDNYHYIPIWDGLLFEVKNKQSFPKIIKEYKNFLREFEENTIVIVNRNNILSKIADGKNEYTFEEIFNEKYFEEDSEELIECLVAFLILENTNLIEIHNFYCGFYNGSDLTDVDVKLGYKEDDRGKTNYNDTTKKKTMDNYLLTKNTEGDYFYKDIRIEVPKYTVYYKVFDILFSKRNEEGFLSYEDIEKGLVKRLVPEAKDKQTKNKRINNAISSHQGFFRYAKVNDKKLLNQTPEGKKLVEIVRGKGLKLNNPRIK